MVIGTKVVVFDPTEGAVVEHGRPAPRLASLNGKVIGLYNNRKENADKLLELVGGILSERYSLAGFVRGTYNGGRVMRRDEWDGIEKCDAIILTNGD